MAPIGVKILEISSPGVAQPGRMPVEDGYIAAMARRHGFTIATANDRDFKRPGLKVFNSFKELV